MEVGIFFRIVIGAKMEFLYFINFIAASATLNLHDAITESQGWLLHYCDHRTPTLSLADLEFTGSDGSLFEYMTRSMQAERLVSTAKEALDVIQPVVEEEGYRNVMQGFQQLLAESRAQIQANPDSKEWVLKRLVNMDMTPKCYDPVDAADIAVAALTIIRGLYDIDTDENGRVIEEDERMFREELTIRLFEKAHAKVSIHS